jgi:N-acetylglucosaminyldiphosphoundecaprenol N-acetyl-beta-D-mannosaminyltransferase
MITKEYLSMIHIFNTEFVNVNRNDACDLIEENIVSNDEFDYIAVKDVALTVRSYEDHFLYQFYKTIPKMIFIDGKGLIYAGFLLGTKFREMVGGPGIYYEMLKRSEINGYKIYLLGGNENVLEMAIVNIKKRHPNIIIVGYRNGYFEEENEYQIVDEINQSKCNILLLGISTPKREKFIYRNHKRFERFVCIAIGGVFDNEAGITKYAPKIVSLVGLEWLYRVIQEPRRLALRYSYTHSRFIIYIIKELWNKISNNNEFKNV